LSSRERQSDYRDIQKSFDDEFIENAVDFSRSRREIKTPIVKILSMGERKKVSASVNSNTFLVTRVWGLTSLRPGTLPMQRERTNPNPPA
jgi:hypothetical protein